MSDKTNFIKSVMDKLLVERAIDYGDRPERMAPGHERNLAQKQTTFSDHPAMPEVNPEGIPSDYPEVLASKRYAVYWRKISSKWRTWISWVATCFNGRSLSHI